MNNKDVLMDLTDIIDALPADKDPETTILSSFEPVADKWTPDNPLILLCAPGSGYRYAEAALCMDKRIAIIQVDVTLRASPAPVIATSLMRDVKNAIRMAQQCDKRAVVVMHDDELTSTADILDQLNVDFVHVFPYPDRSTLATRFNPAFSYKNPITAGLWRGTDISQWELCAARSIVPACQSIDHNALHCNDTFIQGYRDYVTTCISHCHSGEMLMFIPVDDRLYDHITSVLDPWPMSCDSYVKEAALGPLSSSPMDAEGVIRRSRRYQVDAWIDEDRHVVYRSKSSVSDTTLCDILESCNIAYLDGCPGIANPNSDVIVHRSDLAAVVEALERLQHSSDTPDDTNLSLAIKRLKGVLSHNINWSTRNDLLKI